MSIAETEISGCFIQRSSPVKVEPSVTYHRDIAPILNRCCVECHREGQIGPFRLTSYADAAAWSATISERIADGTMPPWHADPQFGKFANERQLSTQERKQIEAWIAAGVPEGTPGDAPPAPRFADRWNIGIPDKIVVMPVPFQVPASGIVENIAVELDPGFTEDAWIRFPSDKSAGNRCSRSHVRQNVGVRYRIHYALTLWPLPTDIRVHPRNLWPSS